MLVSHTLDLLTHPYDIRAVDISYGRLNISPVWDNSHCYIIHRTYTLVWHTNCIIMSYGWLVNSSVWHRYIVVVSYGWLTKSSIWDNNIPMSLHWRHVNVIVPSHHLGWGNNPSVWDSSHTWVYSRHTDEWMTHPYDMYIIYMYIYIYE